MASQRRAGVAKRARVPCSAKLENLRAIDRLVNRPAAPEHVEPARGFGPNVVGLACCSQVRPGIGVNARSRERRRGGHRARKAVFDRLAGRAQLQHERRIHDVLACGAAMDVACRLCIPRADSLGQFAHQRNDDIAVAGGLAGQGSNVIQLGSGYCPDVRQTRCGDDAHFCLRDRQRDLDIEQGL